MLSRESNVDSQISPEDRKKKIEKMKRIQEYMIWALPGGREKNITEKKTAQRQKSSTNLSACLSLRGASVLSFENSAVVLP
jgi:hypothetical protein